MPWGIKKRVAIIIGLAFLGFVDAIYLTMDHYLNLPVPCSIVKGCEKVLSSQYSVMAGIPTSFFGVAYYLVIFVVFVLYLDTRKTQLVYFGSFLTAVGFLASIYFVFLQVFILKAVCLYCLFSASTSTLLFVLGISIILDKVRVKAISG